jgi:uncharacterized membrane protein
VPDGVRSEILRTVRFAALAALLVTYALLVHHVNASGQASVLGATLALVPLAILGLALALRRESRTGGILLLLALTAAAWSSWTMIQQHTSLIFWLQDISLILVLFATFGRTLLAGRKPLCVGFAEAMHGGTLPPEHRRYAVKVTIAWVIFFGAMATASTLLFFYAPLATWSFFVNFLTLPLVALMFIAEYLVRRYMLPDAPVAHILAAVKAYRNMTLRKH